MKKFLILLLICNFCIAQNSADPKGATPVEKSEVPTLIIEKFTKEFPRVQPSWMREGDNFKAVFENQETHLPQSVIYDRNGNVIRRETQLDELSAPGAINEFYNKNFPGEKLNTWEAEDNSGVKTYYTKRSTEVIRFDKDGKLLRDEQKIQPK
jgi:hypothetical protein